jgi:hypothetical protein
LESAGIHGTSNWKKVSLDVGVGPRTCRDRYFVLTEKPNRSPFSKDEHARILELVGKIGQKWVQIARDLGNRTGKQVQYEFKKIEKKTEDETLEKLAELGITGDEEFDYNTEIW